MYSEKWLCKKILNRLHYTMKNMSSAEKMLLEKRPPQDVFCQLRAAQGGIKKILEDIFDEACRKDLTQRINRLLQCHDLTAEQAETLTGIRKQIGACTINKLLRLEIKVKNIERHFLFLGLQCISFFNELLQNPLPLLLS